MIKDVELVKQILDNIEKEIISMENMHVLERILKEIKDSAKIGNMQGEMARIDIVEKILRKHLSDIPKTNANDDWIPCNKRLPEVPEGLADMYCPEFNVTIKGTKVATTLKYSCDGTWFDDNGYIYDVVAWKPLPDAYKEQA